MHLLRSSIIFFVSEKNSFNLLIKLWKKIADDRERWEREWKRRGGRRYNKNNVYNHKQKSMLFEMNELLTM